MVIDKTFLDFALNSLQDCFDTPKVKFIKILLMNMRGDRILNENLQGTHPLYYKILYKNTEDEVYLNLLKNMNEDPFAVYYYTKFTQKCYKTHGIVIL